MDKKIFHPKNYGMATCPSCDSHGFIQDPKRRCCPKCGGFGFIRKEGKTFDQKDKLILAAISDGQ